MHLSALVLSRFKLIFFQLLLLASLRSMLHQLDFNSTKLDLRAFVLTLDSFLFFAQEDLTSYCSFI